MLKKSALLIACGILISSAFSFSRDLGFDLGGLISFSPGDVIRSADVNHNFQHLGAEIQGLGQRVGDIEAGGGGSNGCDCQEFLSNSVDLGAGGLQEQLLFEVPSTLGLDASWYLEFQILDFDGAPVISGTDLQIYVKRTSGEIIPLSKASKYSGLLVANLLVRSIQATDEIWVSSNLPENAGLLSARLTGYCKGNCPSSGYIFDLEDQANSIYFSLGDQLPAYLRAEAFDFNGVETPSDWTLIITYRPTGKTQTLTSSSGQFSNLGLSPNCDFSIVCDSWTPGLRLAAEFSYRL
jgi:hypothetical protein